MINKVLMLFILMLVATPAFAYENFILLSDGEISNVSVKDNKIISVEPVVTLTNEKKSAIITSLKIGNTEFSFNKGKRLVTFKVKVNQDKTVISNVAGVKFIPIDLPPQLKK